MPASTSKLDLSFLTVPAYRQENLPLPTDDFPLPVDVEDINMANFPTLFIIYHLTLGVLESDSPYPTDWDLLLSEIQQQLLTIGYRRDFELHALKLYVSLFCSMKGSSVFLFDNKQQSLSLDFGGFSMERVDFNAHEGHPPWDCRSDIDDVWYNLYLASQGTPGRELWKQEPNQTEPSHETRDSIDLYLIKKTTVGRNSVTEEDLEDILQNFMRRGILYYDERGYLPREMNAAYTGAVISKDDRCLVRTAIIRLLYRGNRPYYLMNKLFVYLWDWMDPSEPQLSYAELILVLSQLQHQRLITMKYDCIFQYGLEIDVGDTIPDSSKL